jgi:hypothetical protein
MHLVPNRPACFVPQRVELQFVIDYQKDTSEEFRLSSALSLPFIRPFSLVSQATSVDVSTAFFTVTLEACCDEIAVDPPYVFFYLKSKSMLRPLSAIPVSMVFSHLSASVEPFSSCLAIVNP